MCMCMCVYLFGPVILIRTRFVNSQYCSVTARTISSCATWYRNVATPTLQLNRRQFVFLIGNAMFRIPKELLQLLVQLCRGHCS